MKTFRDAAKEHNQALEASLDSLDRSFQPALDLCLESLREGGKLLICGNGGSAADAQHFAAELVGHCEEERTNWPALALSTDTSVITAIANDYGFEQCFAKQVEVIGNRTDLLLAISTSGNSPNVLRAADAARRRGMKVIAFTGAEGGKLKAVADVSFSVSSKSTARIQEIHRICLHSMAEAIKALLDGHPRG